MLSPWLDADHLYGNRAKIQGSYNLRHGHLCYNRNSDVFNGQNQKMADDPSMMDGYLHRAAKVFDRKDRASARGIVKSRE